MPQPPRNIISQEKRFPPPINIIFAKQNGVKSYSLPFSLVYAIILLNPAKIMH